MLRRCGRLAAQLAVLLSAATCSVSPLEYVGYRCDTDGACVTDFECNTITNICVPVTDRSCPGQGESVCWSDITGGETCLVEGSFLPCGPAADCSDGCRTCSDRQWSQCDGSACTIGTLKNCSACDVGCGGILNAAAICSPVGTGHQCDYSGTCDAGFVDADGDRTNGCECAEGGGTETCDDIDNDCDGQTDNVADIVSECDGLNPGGFVSSWSCTNGACTVEGCAAGHYNYDNLPDCEYACTTSNGGTERCDGQDNDCSGTADDFTATVDAQCASQHQMAVNVASWACAGGCAIAGCAIDWTISGNVDDGCNVPCTPTGPEICDSVDNDCNGAVDDTLLGASGCTPYYIDNDGDGFGADGASECWCSPTGSFVVADNTDCDDTSDLCTTTCTDSDSDAIADCRDDCVDIDQDGLGDGTLGNTGCVIQTDDEVPADPALCLDSDGDGCDDCSKQLGFLPDDDGTDTDSDGACDAGDDDDDNDGVLDVDDGDSLDPSVCEDVDNDGCDDCSRALTGGGDGFGPQPDNDPSNDGTDDDSDGWCDATDCRDDLPAVNPAAVEGPATDTNCGDGIDNNCNGATDGPDPYCQWWDFAWLSRRQVTFINDFSGSGVLQDFPVMLRLTDEYGRIQDAGEDLRFVDADHVTLLPYEIERYSESGTSIVWVMVPQIDATATDHIWMYYEHDTGTTDAQDAAKVWDSNFVGVWHLKEDATVVGQKFGDSTFRANDATKTGSGHSTVTTGLGGLGLSLNGSGSLRVPDAPELRFTGNVPYTVSVWFNNENDDVGTWQGLVSKGNAQQYAVTYNRDDNFVHYETNQSGASATNTNDNTVNRTSRWHIVIRYNGGTKRVFINGTQRASQNKVVDSLNNTEDLRIGEGNNGERFAGWLDEIRISSIARPVRHIRASYRNQEPTIIFAQLGTPVRQATFLP